MSWIDVALIHALVSEMSCLIQGMHCQHPRVGRILVNFHLNRRRTAPVCRLSLDLASESSMSGANSELS